jgi:hypothetical protein
LLKNQNLDKTEFFVFVDGPRNSEDEANIQETLSEVQRFSNYARTRLRKSEKNLGLVNSIRFGINEIFETHDQIIVLEDDLIVPENFIEYMNLGLEKFKDDERIASIQGYSNVNFWKRKETYFQLGADCWGWATWKDRWMEVNWNADEALTELTEKKMEKKFDLNGAYPYTKMLERCARGEVESWAIRWHASMFILGKLSVYPPRTLVINTGRDGSGTHMGDKVTRNEYLSNHVINFSGDEPKESVLINWKIRRELRRRYNTHSFLSFRKYINFVLRKIEYK